jgi:glutathione S-transferase
MADPGYMLIGSPQSRTFRVLWMLGELGVPYQHLPDSPDAAGAMALSPSGQGPVLIVDGEAITDSTAILQFLADRHACFTHAAGTLERARQDAMTQFLLDAFDSVLWMTARHGHLLPEALRQSAMRDSLKLEMARSQKKLVARMSGGPFVMGAEMTVPDIILAHCGIWSEAAKVPLSEPVLAAHLTRMRNRPVFRRLGAL